MRIVIVIGLLAACWFILDRSMVAPASAAGRPTVAQIGGCDLPLPSDGAALVFASYYEGAGISTIKLPQSGSQSDETTALDVVISPGVRPIYLLVAGSRPSVLRFHGWTKRLERVVVVSGTDFPQGVTGLSASILTFADTKDCAVPLSDLYKASRKDLIDDGLVAGIVKRPFPASMRDEERMKQRSMFRMPDVIGGAYDPYKLTVGSFFLTARTFKGRDHASGLPDWYEKTRAADFDPAGVLDVDPMTLIAPVEGIPYTLLPGRAGLGELVRDGKVRGEGDGTYTILAPITFPDGLYGAVSVNFALAPGVPYPQGDPGHSKVR